MAQQLEGAPNLLVHVTASTDPECCALPIGVHRYTVELSEALQRVLELAPIGSYLFDGTQLVLTAQSIDYVEGG